MKPPEEIRTHRLVLRPPRISDVASMFTAYATDPEVTKYLVWQPHKDKRETETFVRRCAEGWAIGDELAWAITLKENAEFVGMTGLRIHGFKAEIGYAIAKKFWGKGLTAEGIKPIVEWALAQPGIYRVWALCDVDNPASARVLEKVGMQREGILQRSSLHPNVSNEPRDCYCYAIVK